MARLRESLERRIYTRCKCGCNGIVVRDRWAARERAREAFLIVTPEVAIRPSFEVHLLLL